MLDPVTQQYHLHSIVKMPEKKKEDEVIIELITEEELEELEKEGEAGSRSVWCEGGVFGVSVPLVCN